MKKLHNIIFVLAIAFVFISCVDEDAETCNELELRFLEEPPNHSECNFVRNNCSAFPQISDFCMTANHLPNPDGPVPCEGNTERNVNCGLNNRDIGLEVCVNGFFTLLPGSCTDEDECIDDTTETKSCTRDGFPDFPGEKFRACNNGKWSDFTECHICDEGDTLECDIDSVFLVTPRRLCQPKNEYSDCTIVDFENDISGVLYYKEIGDFRGDTFKTTNHVEEFSVSFWMRFDEGTKPIGIFALGSGGTYGNYLNLSVGDIGCLSTEYCMPESGYHHSFVFGTDSAERVRTPNEDNHIVVTMSQNHFRYYLNGVEVTTITRNNVPQYPENGFDEFDFPGLPAGTEFELGHGMNDLGVVHYLSHTTIIDGILSPEDVKLLHAKGPASP